MRLIQCRVSTERVSTREGELLGGGTIQASSIEQSLGLAELGARRDRHYREKKILSESVFLKPRLFGTFSDTERHCVSFTDRKHVHWLSEPHTAHESTDDDTLRQDVEAAIRDVGDTALSPAGLSDLLGQMVRVIDRDVRDFAVAGRHHELLNYVGYLARVYFQAEMLVVRVANMPPRSATLAPPPSGTGGPRLGGAQAS